MYLFLVGLGLCLKAATNFISIFKNYNFSDKTFTKVGRKVNTKDKTFIIRAAVESGPVAR